MTIYPDIDLNRWEVETNCNVVLANADYYYTKGQVDDLIEEHGGTTPEEVEEIVDRKIVTKADKSEVNALAEQVRANTEAILDRYTKAEVNGLLASYKTKMEANKDLAEYAAINGDVLSLNDKNIG